MNKVVALRDQGTELAEPIDRNPFEEYGDEAFQSNIVGQLLKLSKEGEWLAGQEEEPIADGTEMVAAMHLLQCGWVRWGENGPLESRLGLKAEGHRPEERSTLGFMNKEEWFELNGQKIDPWRRTDVLLLADPQTGQIYTFSPMSEGGLQATKMLSREYGAHIREHGPGEIPVIRLGSTWYKHQRFGRIYKPVLEVIDWRDASDVSFEAAEEDAEAQEVQEAAAQPRPAPRAQVKPAPKVAAKPAAKSAAKPAARSTAKSSGRSRY